MPATPKTVIVQPGQQITLTGTVEDTIFDGRGKGGKAADDNADNAMVIIRRDARLHAVEIKGSQGVGCKIAGPRVFTQDCEFHHNAASGRTGRSKGDGTPGSGYHEVRAHIHDNNHKLKKGNAGNKVTNSTDYLIDRTIYHNECGPDQWFDINCERITMQNVAFGTNKNRKPGTNDPLFRAELGRPGGLRLIRCTFGDTKGAALSLDESTYLEVIDPSFGACRFAAELRNMLRRDDPTGKWKNNRPVNWKKFTWRLFDVTITGEILITPKTGPVVRSDASNAPVTLSDNDLAFGPILVVKIKP